MLLLGGGQEQNPYINSPFGIKALSTGSTNIKFAKSGSPSAITLYYKIDNGSWTNYTINTSITLAKDQICYFSGTTQTFSYGNGSYIYYYLSASNQIEALGNINSLVNGKQTLTKCQYRNMFIDNYLKSIDNLVLSADTLDEYCYNSMFSGCTGLSSIPQNLLPATKLAPYCYQNMFNGCTSLTATPSLPATTLTRYCYFSMFNGCTALTSAPQLPASTLTDYCYAFMFAGCNRLTSAPALPATALASSCYNGMFRGCSNITSAKIDAININYAYCMYNMFSGCSKLSSIEVNFTSWPTASNALFNWVSGVAATGQFICPAVLPHNSSQFGVNKIPSGWTVITK